MADTKIIVIPDGKICDYIDGKFRNDTPEEYVRQTIEKRLVNEHKYLPSQIKIEYTLQVGSNKPRADIVIWEKGADQTQGTIKLIIECKKETVDASPFSGKCTLRRFRTVCRSGAISCLRSWMRSRKRSKRSRAAKQKSIRSCKSISQNSTRNKSGAICPASSYQKFVLKIPGIKRYRGGDAGWNRNPHK